MFTALDLSSQQARGKQFPSIDVAKFVCAILVVMLHTSLFADVNTFFNYGVQTITRVAVPFFLLRQAIFALERYLRKLLTGKYHWRMFPSC